MGSTFSGIELGKRSIMAHTDAITTAGHNISNANTEGYSRQRVQLKEFDPLYKPDLERAERAGMIGQGMDSQSINRVRDELLDQRITEQQHSESYWETRSKYYTMIEQIYNEPDDVSIRSNMDKFWEGWQELSVHPESQAARQAVVTRGESLADSIKTKWEALMGVGNLINGDIEATVKQVNDYTRQIAALNAEIVRSRGMGDNPNDLLDRRDLLVDKLSKIINITSDRRDSDEFMVHLDGHVLVQGGIARGFELETVVDNNGYDKLVWKDTGNDAVIKGGTLGALIELRDVDIRSEVQSLNTMTMNFSDLVNDIHRNGYGANNVTGLDFFTQHSFVENVNGNYDRDGDGTLDHSYIFRFTGTTKLNPQEQIGLEGVMTLSGPGGNVQVAYHPTDTVETVINRINDSNGEVKAYLDRNNNLVLKGTTASAVENPDFVIRHVEDSGFFLTGYTGILQASGAAGAYDYAQADAVQALAGAQFAVSPVLNPAGYIEVNQALKNDVMSVAAAYKDNSGNVNAGDGRAAVEIAAIRNTKVMIGHERTFDDYFADSVTNVGLKGEQAENMHLSHSAVMEDLRSLRDSISGVNIDEELADIIKFQHGYNAAAKFVTVWDSLLDTIINRLGV
ncbi:MAG: flagellar hook-associated protein FlgK [Treponema porcinum]|uniref:flagellar hook-associated protein FlgK n=2 Tax=Treponema TaxID=157 RepID=UPI0023521ACF|nr:flagellar hook-associated protein FlgK [Treponema porcinum]MCI5645451.1 flagellar hook-associated protein FlgK [Treponema porcinum]MCI6180536.1 flagellar hook-associated protein FlgK [Treponema porcinum]MCI6322877.1 flagellar hook-associated protein FlgK [Treponema porcinum]MCI6722148.1 flagellar hook-associated protein FlgK [Treponema porcinum]MCI6815270.1 flagellar hook-associated protein FlgK [Treponema porcinum]